MQFFDFIDLIGLRQFFQNRGQINVAAPRIKIAIRQRTGEIKTGQIAAEDILDAPRQKIQQIVNIAIWNNEIIR